MYASGRELTLTPIRVGCPLMGENDAAIRFPTHRSPRQALGCAGHGARALFHIEQLIAATGSTIASACAEHRLVSVRSAHERYLSLPLESR